MEVFSNIETIKQNMGTCEEINKNIIEYLISYFTSSKPLHKKPCIDIRESIDNYSTVVAILWCSEVSTVIVVYDETIGTIKVIKLLDCLTDEDQDNINEEYKFLRRIKEAQGVNEYYLPKVVYLIYFEKIAMFVYPYYGITLKEFIQNYKARSILLDKNIIKKICTEILIAINFLHNINIIHADIKPDNIVINDVCRLIDFNISAEEYEDRIVSTAPYRAPEVLVNDKWDTKIDLWSFGCVLYEIITTKPLFCVQDDTNISLYLEKINIVQTYRFMEIEDPDLKDLVIQLLKKNKNDRISADMALKHKYIVGDGM